MNSVTGILNRIEDGEPNAARRLLPLVHDARRRWAAQRKQDPTFSSRTTSEEARAQEQEP